MYIHIYIYRMCFFVFLKTQLLWTPTNVHLPAWPWPKVLGWALPEFNEKKQTKWSPLSIFPSPSQDTVMLHCAVCWFMVTHLTNYSFRIAKPKFTQLQTTLQILAGMQIASTLEPSKISLLIGYEQGFSGLSTYQVCLALCKYILVYPRQYRPRINNHCWLFWGAFPKTPW